VQYSFSSMRVVCLCAQWCGTCREYRSVFDSLQEMYPEIECVWVDVEEYADMLSDLDIENFPTLLVYRGSEVVFWGAIFPLLQHVVSLVRSLMVQEASPLSLSADEHDCLEGLGHYLSSTPSLFNSKENKR
jgi:thioredoxin 1